MANKKRVKKIKKLDNKQFWTTLGALFIVSFIIIVIFSQNNLTGKTIQNIAFVEEGSKMNMKSDVYGLDKTTLHFSSQLKNAQVTIEKPVILGWKQKGVELARFKISFTDEDKLSKIDLTSKIEEEKIHASGLSNEEVRFYLNGKELSTTVEKIDRGYVYHKTTTEAVGEFVIGKKEVVKATTVIAPKKEPQPLEQKVEPVIEPEPQQPPVEPEPKKFFEKVGDFFNNLFN